MSGKILKKHSPENFTELRKLKSSFTTNPLKNKTNSSVFTTPILNATKSPELTQHFNYQTSVRKKH